MRIIFLGTPEFAAYSLESLLRAGLHVAAVVTAPDTPSGRGLRMQAPPVKLSALAHGIPVLQPLKLKDPAFLEELERYKADLQVVVAFRMLPEAVWNMPRLGTFNLHASLLPQYRGAAPINRAVMNGEQITGVTTFFLRHEIDTGNILFREEVGIGPEETAGELHDRLKVIGGSLVVKTALAIANDTIQPIPQEEITLQGTTLKPAPKIYREDCRIRWDQPAEKIFNHIRGLSPYPGAFSNLLIPDGEPISIKIFRVAKAGIGKTEVPGTIRTDPGHSIKVACQDGWLEILVLQQPGKKKMAAKEFLIGMPPGLLKRFEC